MTHERSAVEAKPAATLMLLRDGPDGIEVFMVVRHHKIDFASGAMVFPGGKVDPGDAHPRLRAHCVGAQGLDERTLALRIAGVREAFEECGVLFARRAGETGPLAPAEASRLEPWAARLRADETDMLALVEAEGLELLLDALVPFAHWVTPPHVPKRFDTHFFLAAAPRDQVALHDGRESVDSAWAHPLRVIDDAESGRVKLVFATRMNLLKLSRSATVAAAVAAAREARVVRVMPELMSSSGDVRRLRIPAEAGYGGSQFEVSDKPAMP